MIMLVRERFLRTYLSLDVSATCDGVSTDMNAPLRERFPSTQLSPKWLATYGGVSNFGPSKELQCH